MADLKDLMAQQAAAPTDSNSAVFTKLLLGLAPILAGAAFGGSRGGAIGAEAGITGTKLLASQEEKAKEETAAKAKLAAEKMTKAEELGLKKAELALKGRELAAKGTKEAGPTKLPPDKVIAISEFKAIPQLLQDLNSSIEQNEQLFGRASGTAAGAITKIYPLDVVDTLNAQISNVRQTVGKLKEGGVLRAEDEVKYKKMLPELTDSPQVAKNKIQLVLREMNQKYLTTVGALQSAGYDVSPFTAQAIEVPGLPQTVKSQGGMPQAFAASKPDFSKMSDEELRKYLGQ